MTFHNAPTPGGALATATTTVPPAEVREYAGRNRPPSPPPKGEVTWEGARGGVTIVGCHPPPQPKKVSGTFCRDGPKGAAHKRFLTPFSGPSVRLAPLQDCERLEDRARFRGPGL